MIYFTPSITFVGVVSGMILGSGAPAQAPDSPCVQAQKFTIRDCAETLEAEW